MVRTPPAPAFLGCRFCELRVVCGRGVCRCHGQRTVTVFSAPNYCYRCGNQAAIMEVWPEPCRHTPRASCGHIRQISRLTC